MTQSSQSRVVKVLGWCCLCGPRFVWWACCLCSVVFTLGVWQVLLVDSVYDGATDVAIFLRATF